MIAVRRRRRPGRTRHERAERGVWVAATAVSAALVWWYLALFLAPAPGQGPATLAADVIPGDVASTAGRPFIGPVLAPTAATTPIASTRSDTDPPAGSGISSQFVTNPASDASAEQRARIAVEVAMAQIGLPYVWGGNGPEDGHRGFDCSGLTTFAYAKAGVALPRTAHTQFRHGPRLPAGAELRPGDLVFYGTYAKVHHVGMFIGQGRMVNAPTFGQPVQAAWYRWTGDDYFGATRPTARPGNDPLPLREIPETPDPTIPDVDVFPAPPAPPLPAPAPIVTTTARPSPTGTSHVAAPTTPTGPVTATVSPEPIPATAGAPVTSPNAPTASQSTSPRTGTLTPASPVAPMPTPTAPAPDLPAPVAIIDAGTLRPLSPVELGSDRVPITPGGTSDAGQWLVRLSAPLAASSPGSGLVVLTAQGEHHLTIDTTRDVGTAEVTELTEQLVVLATLGPGRWQVTTASPAQ